MLRARPIHYTSRPKQWAELLEALGLVNTVKDDDWFEFDAGSGRLALHRVQHGAAVDGSPQDGTTAFGVEVGVLAEFARRTQEDGTIAVLTEASHGYQDNQFRAGLEYRLGRVELRGAGRYSNGWYPSAGAGFNLTRNFGVDVAVFGTQTFLEPEAHVGLAVSLRVDKR